MEFLYICDSFSAGLSFQGYLPSKHPEVKATISFWVGGHICSLTRIIKIISPLGASGDRFASSPFIRGFPKISDPSWNTSLMCVQHPP